MTGAVNLIELFSAGGGGATGSTRFISSCLISGSSSCDKVVTSVITSFCFGVAILISVGILNPTKAITSTISIADVKGNDEENGKDIADLKQVVTQAEPEPEKVFDMVEQMPTYPGGNAELMAFLAKNIKYPTIAQENGTQGRVIVQFVVEKDGSIADARVARGVDPYLDKEALRVIQSMPRWIPGKQNGKAESEIYSSGNV